MADEHQLDERLRGAEEDIRGLRTTVYGNGDKSNALVSQVAMIRQRTHDIANVVQGIDGRIIVAVKDRDHALDAIRSDFERHKGESMSKADAEVLAKAMVAEMRGKGERKLNTWLLFAGVVISSTIGPMILRLVAP